MLGNLSKKPWAKSIWARIALLGVLSALGALGFGVLKLIRTGPILEQSTSLDRSRLSLNLPDSDGRSRSLEEFSQFQVLVHFWATWCPPCVDELPQLLEFARRMPSKRVLVVSLDETWEKAHLILPRSGLPPNVISLLDASGSVANAWGSYQFPETYVLEPGLKLKSKWVGPQDWLSLGVPAKVR